jgi:hypothetical protein
MIMRCSKLHFMAELKLLGLIRDEENPSLEQIAPIRCTTIHLDRALEKMEPLALEL